MDKIDAGLKGNADEITAHISNQTVHATTLSCSKAGTVYALTGLTATAGKVPALFSAPAAYAVGDTVTIDGTAYTLATVPAGLLTDGAWAAGAIVTGTADVDAKTLTVEPSAPVGAAKPSDIPTSLKSPAALTVQNGYGNTPATYDGSAAKTISVPYVTLNTAAPTATLAAGALWGVY